MILKKIGTGESYDKIVSIVVEVLHTFPAQVEDSSCLFILVPMLSDCGLFERTFPNCYLGFSSKFSQKTEIREQAIIVPFCAWNTKNHLKMSGVSINCCKRAKTEFHLLSFI